MNWNQEQEAQRNYGRSQMMNDNFGNTLGNESRPFYDPNNAYTPQRHFNDGMTTLPKQLDRGIEVDQRGHIGMHVNGIDRRFVDGKVSGGSYHKAEKPKGHMGFLHDIHGKKVRIVTILGDDFTGILKGADEKTISLRIDCPTNERPDAYQNRVFFKQNLVEFAPVIEGVTFS